MKVISETVKMKFNGAESLPVGALVKHTPDGDVTPTDNIAEAIGACDGEGNVVIYGTLDRIAQETERQNNAR